MIRCRLGVGRRFFGRGRNELFGMKWRIVFAPRQLGDPSSYIVQYRRWPLGWRTAQAAVDEFDTSQPDFRWRISRFDTKEAALIYLTHYEKAGIVRGHQTVVWESPK